MKNLFYSFLFLLLSLVTTTAQSQTDADANLKVAWAKTKKMLAKFSARVPNIGGTFAMIENGKIIGKYNFGYADQEQKIKVNDHTLFSMGSISKIITAIAIFQLQERGKLSLHDPVTTYIPELKKAPQDFGGFDSVKIHHLINHTTHYDRGVALYKQLIKDHPKFEKQGTYCFEDLKPYLHLFKFTGKPGAKHMYSNWGYSLLGVVVERVSKTPYTPYVHQQILEPLGMMDSYFGATSPKRKKHLAKCYKADSLGTISPGKQPTYSQCFGEANGGLKSNVSDMLKLMNFFTGMGTKAEQAMHDQVLQRKTIQDNFTLNEQTIQDATKLVYQYRYKTYQRGKLSGLTFMNWGDIDKSYLGHSGHIYDYISTFHWRNNKKVGVIWMVNTAGHQYSDEACLKYIITTLQNQLLLKLSVTDRTWEDYQKMYGPRKK